MKHENKDQDQPVSVIYTGLDQRTSGISKIISKNNQQNRYRSEKSRRYKEKYKGSQKKPNSSAMKDGLWYQKLSQHFSLKLYINNQSSIGICVGVQHRVLDRVQHSRIRHRSRRLHGCSGVHRRRFRRFWRLGHRRRRRGSGRRFPRSRWSSISFAA